MKKCLYRMYNTVNNNMVGKNIGVTESEVLNGGCLVNLKYLQYLTTLVKKASMMKRNSV